MIQTESFGLSGRRSCVRAEYAGTGLQFVNANVVAIVRDIRRIRKDCRGVVDGETFPYPG
jgi:hypothetical protein